MLDFDPIGDVFKIEVGSTDNPLDMIGGENPDEGVRIGRVVAIGARESVNFFGFATYMFDKSLVDDAILDRLYAHYSKYIGKMVKWPQLCESGTLHQGSDGKKYVYVKWSAVDGVEKGTL